MKNGMQSRWNITMKTPMGERDGLLELNVDGATLTGSMSHADHRVAIHDGKVEGNRLSWTAKITKPMRLSFKFTATIEGDRISGAARNMLGNASFTGTRV
jgi:hypothetical protein